MPRPIRLYVSSSPDLGMEREALGRAVAWLPVATGWEIRHTPGPGEPMTGILPFIASCDVYVVLLGADFAAPMGNEWREALSSGHPMLAFCKEGLHSPSAQWVLSQKEARWEFFPSAVELEPLLTRRLARVLLDHGERMGLHLGDVEGLLSLLTEEKEPERPREPDRRRGAGRSGVIVGREGVGSGEEVGRVCGFGRCL